MNHFILTRFNLHLHWNTDKAGHDVLTDEWLAERFRLFETYCLPSILAQKCKNFKWICLFDENTPEVYKKRIQGYQKLWDGFLPFYLNEEETNNFPRYFQMKVFTLSNPNDEEVLTTYLDNDDCLRDDFILKIQEAPRRAKFNTMFLCRYGVQYYEDMNIAVEVSYRNNHYTTYYERLNPHLLTVWGFSHFHVFKRYDYLNTVIIQNKANPIWIEVIHNNNIDNDVKMTFNQKLITDHTYLRRFGIDTDLLPASEAKKVFRSKFALRFLRQSWRRFIDKILFNKNTIHENENTTLSNVQTK